MANYQCIILGTKMFSKKKKKKKKEIEQMS